MTYYWTFFKWLDTFESSIWLREATYSYSTLLAAHIVTMCLFAGLILMMDLRLVGWGNLRTPISQMQKRLFPWQMLGMALSAVSGLILVYSQPMRYAGKIFFWTKMGLMMLAGVNAIVFHLTTYKSVASWDNDRVLPFGARLAGMLSIGLWALIVIFGRLTPYNWIDDWVTIPE
jgi:hypothetical protein